MESQIAHNSCTPAPERIISSHYDYSKVFQFVDSKDKEVYGSRFFLYPEDQTIVLQLAAYSLRDEELWKKHKVTDKRK